MFHVHARGGFGWRSRPPVPTVSQFLPSMLPLDGNFLSERDARPVDTPHWSPILNSQTLNKYLPRCVARLPSLAPGRQRSRRVIQTPPALSPDGTRRGTLYSYRLWQLNPLNYLSALISMLTGPWTWPGRVKNTFHPPRR